MRGAAAPFHAANSIRLTPDFSSPEQANARFLGSESAFLGRKGRLEPD